MIKKLVEERFRGPTDDPSFADPGYNEAPGSQEAMEQSQKMLDRADGGKLVPLKDDIVLRFEDFGDGDGQYLVGTKEQVMDPENIESEVFRKDQRDNLEEMLATDILNGEIDVQNNLGEQKMNLESLIEKLYENQSGMTLNENSQTNFISSVATKVILNLTEGIDEIDEQDEEEGKERATKQGAANKLRSIAGNISQRLRGAQGDEITTIMKLFDKLSVLSQRGGKFTGEVRRRLELLFRDVNNEIGVDPLDGYALKKQKPGDKVPGRDTGRDTQPGRRVPDREKTDPQGTRVDIPPSRTQTQAGRSRNVGRGGLMGRLFGRK